MILSIRFLLATLAILSISSDGLGQDPTKEKLAKAKEFFWEAKFDSAKVYLDEILRIRSSSEDILFDAYLYKGFVASRETQATELRSNFIQAIKIDPSRKIDEDFFPPDLVELFDAVRNQIVGCMFINTRPINAEITVLWQKKMSDTTTPSMFCNLTNQDYEVLIVKKDYQEEYAKFRLTAGKTDTLNITLKPKLAQRSGGSKWWLWALGGAVATSAAVVFATVLENNDNTAQGSGLPFPPRRPTVDQ